MCILRDCNVLDPVPDFGGGAEGCVEGDRLVTLFRNILILELLNGARSEGTEAGSIA